MRLTRAPWLVGLSLLASCSTTPVVTTQPPASASATTPSSSAPAIRPVGDAPVLEGNDVGGKTAVLPGALVIIDGTYHAFLVGFGQQPGDQRVFYGTSEDGMTWSLDEADPLEGIGLELDLNPPGPIPTSVLIETDGSWTMYLWGVTDPSGFRASIWRATATTPEGPWVVDPEPVLRGDADAWDSLGVDFASVVRTADGYLMVYVGASMADRNTPHIGMATSTDGITWSKQEDPVLSPGHCGDFDDRAVTQPRLIGTEEGFLLAYSGNGLDEPDAALGLSTSADGLTWSCASTSPLLERADVPGSEGIHTFALADWSGAPQVLVESLIEGGSELWLGELVGIAP